jgi:hypothetical protein
MPCPLFPDYGVALKIEPDGKTPMDRLCPMDRWFRVDAYSAECVSYRQIDPMDADLIVEYYVPIHDPDDWCMMTMNKDGCCVSQWNSSKR